MAMYGRAILCLVSAALSVAASVSEARACTCNAQWMSITWPREGDADVALDTALVLEAMDLDAIETALVADDGSPVELVERRRFEEGDGFTCSKLEAAFLAPRAPLAPNTRYVFRVRNAGPLELQEGGARFDVTEELRSFMTGTRAQSGPAPEVTIEAFGVESPEGRSWEVFVQTSSTEPVFAFGRGRWGQQLRSHDPRFSQGPMKLSLGATECAEVALIDVAGRTFADERQCEPSKCTRAELWSSTCGGELFAELSWDDWQRVPDGCAEGLTQANCTLSRSSPRANATVVLIALALVAMRRRTSGP